MLDINLKKKQKKNSDLLPLGSLFLLGLNSALSTYSQGFLGKKGDKLGLSVNQSVLTYLDPWGHLTLVKYGPVQFCSFVSSYSP